jgi:hypothetical protein
MPTDPSHPHQLAGAQRFRADLVAYLDTLPVGELPSSRQQLLGLGVLLVALNERLPDAYKLLPSAGHPGPGQGRRRSLREVVADRCAARTGRHPNAPASGLAEWLADRQQQADLHAERAGRARWASGGWPRRCASGPATPTRRPATRSAATLRPNRPTGSATASPRTTSTTAGAPTGSAPTTSATNPRLGPHRRYPQARRWAWSARPARVEDPADKITWADNHRTRLRRSWSFSLAVGHRVQEATYPSRALVAD